jgi:protein-tyrosine phosphatase
LIDTHCHLLPGLDDGPRTETDALELARALEAQGVTRVLCTPHFSGMFPTDHAAAVDRLRTLQRLLDSAGLRIETSVAAEIGPAAAVSAPLEQLVERSIGRRFALIEVLADSSAASLAAIFERLGDAGLGTILGHPERCRALHRKPDLLDPLRKEGALLQVVAPSLLGRWGRETEATAWRLIDTGRADILASDAHGASRRRPHVRAACRLIAERLGDAVVEELTVAKPRLILDGVRPE